jgi:hypothetical protein
MIPFVFQGNSAIIAYADDSTDTATELTPGSYGIPNSLLIFNPDTANVVTVNYGFDQYDHNSVVPTSGFNGQGVVVGPNATVQVRVNNTYQTSSLWISVAGVTGTGNVYITPGVI